MNRRLSRPQALYLAAVVAGLVLPLLSLVPMSASPGSTIEALPARWSDRWYVQVLGSAEWRRSFLWSLVTAAAASLLATVLAFLAANALVRRLRRLHTTVLMLVLSPMMVPQVVVALASYMLFTAVGLGGHWIAIAIGQSLLALPVATLIVAASLRGIDAAVLRAAAALGAGGWQVFRMVTFPLALHGILAAAAFSFLIAFDELLIALFLATPGLQTLPVRIYQAVHYELTPAVAVVSVLLTGVLGLVVVAMAAFRSQAPAGQARATG